MRQLALWLGFLFQCMPSGHATPFRVMLDPGHGGEVNKGAPARMRPGTC